MVIPDPGLRAGDDGEDAALPNVRISHQPHVRDGLQLHLQRDNLLFRSRFGKVRRLPGCGGEMVVSPSAPAAVQQDPGFPGGVHVRHHPAALRLPDDGPYRHLDDQILALSAAAHPAHPVSAVFRCVFALESEIQQGVHVFIRVEQDVSALSAVPAVRSAVLDIFLPVEAGGSVSAVPRLHRDLHPVHKISHVNSSRNATVPEFSRPVQ